MVALLNRPIFGAGGDIRRQLAAATAEFRAAVTQTVASTTSRTFSAVSVGTADPARRIVLCVGVADNTAAAGPLTGATCDGVAMTEVSDTNQNSNEMASAIYEIAQGLLPDPTVTTAEFIITVTDGCTDWRIGSYKVLSYAAGVGQGGVRNLSTGTLVMGTISNVGANYCAVGVTIHQGTGGDAMSDPEHTWLNQLVEGDQDNRSGGGNNVSSHLASGDFAAPDASFVQQASYVTTLSSGLCGSVATWEPF